jgi:hypothetical protein
MPLNPAHTATSNQAGIYVPPISLPNVAKDLSSGDIVVFTSQSMGGRRAVSAKRWKRGVFGQTGFLTAARNREPARRLMAVSAPIAG